jgi:hypothetical protein
LYNSGTVTKQEQQMKAIQTPEARFENAVLAKIAGCDFEVAEFVCGTLFVKTDERNARKIHSNLFMGVGGLPFGHVRVTPIGDTGEYAYDFV